MDVTFETSSGKQFTIEIWFFSTTMRIREYIQKHKDIPTSKQTLLFNGEVMQDDRDTEHYGIVQGSKITVNVEDEPQEVTQTQMQVTIKIPVSKKQFAMDVNASDTVYGLKKRIHQAEAIPVNRFVIVHGSNELQLENRTLGEYQIVNAAELSVVVKQVPVAVPKKMKVLVSPQLGKKVALEVNVHDNVSELRKELQRLHHHCNLPSDGYFFIFKQNLMDENRSFRKHDVRQGDTIEIFGGSVTGGAS